MESTLSCAGTTPALRYAKQYLIRAGLTVDDCPGWQTKHLLLDVPSFRPGGADLDTLLSSLPRDVTVWGGNLDHPSLEGMHTVDLLKDEEYLTANAAITADWALDIAAPLLGAPWSETPALIIGWGRIGKCLVRRLKAEHCPVTIAARSEKHRAQLRSLGYPAVDTGNLEAILPRFRFLCNTVPAAVITNSTGCENCVKMDLASAKGIAGEDVLWARGLPGKYAPERSGRLIAGTILRLMKEAEA